MGTKKILTIPELVLLTTFKSVLTYVKVDYENNILDPTKSLLYRVLNDQVLQRYNLFEQAKTVFLTLQDNPRLIDINLFFNAARAHIPTLHITLPSETSVNNTLGIGEGFRDAIYDDNSDGTVYKEVYNRRFKAQYNLVITSDNTNEIVLIYHFMRSVIISLFNHLNLSGLEKIELGGRDIQLNPSLVPTNIFIRAISLDFEYDVGAIDLFDREVFNEIIASQEITLD